MREIKFRAKAGLRWCYGEFYHSERNEPVIYEPQSRGKTLEGIPYDGWRLKVDPETVGQFTGLLDSNGQEIYEGDIIRFAPPLRWEEDERQIGVVVFKYYAFVVKYNDMYTGLFNLAANEAPYTIIGNIHDNPELIKK